MNLKISIPFLLGYFLAGQILARSEKLSSTRITLYDPTVDSVELLFADTFDSIVFNETQIKCSIIEFFAHWCGTCQRVAPHWKEVARETKAWHHLIRVGAVDCAVAENAAICNRYSIMAYPTFLNFNLNSKNQNSPKQIGSSQTSVDDFLKIMIDLIENQNNTNNRDWPVLVPLESSNLSFLFNNAMKFVLLIFEDNVSYCGRKIILDFSTFIDKLIIRRVTPQSNYNLIEKYVPHSNETKEFCEAYVISKDENYKIQSLKVFVKGQSTDREYFKFTDLSENETKSNDPRYTIGSLIRKFIKHNRLINEIDLINISNIIDHGEVLQIRPAYVNEDFEEENYNVNMIDLESSLSYMFRSEITKMHSIKNAHLLALKNWLKVLSKYFPGRIHVVRFLKQIYEKVKPIENELTNTDWIGIVTKNTNYAYIPNNIEWKHCKGSNEGYRGYPCSLWTLFHVLTVNHAIVEKKKSSDFTNFNNQEVISAIVDYVTYFFGCAECSENFANETVNFRSEIDKPYDEILFLWKVHNRVNKRLSKDVTEDPVHPKIQFPSQLKCPQCYAVSNNEFDSDSVLNYLIKYYTNIEGIAELDFEKRKQVENTSNFNSHNKFQVTTKINISKILEEKLNETQMYAARTNVYIMVENLFILIFYLICLLLVVFGFVRLKGKRIFKKKKHIV